MKKDGNHVWMRETCSRQNGFAITTGLSQALVLAGGVHH